MPYGQEGLLAWCRPIRLVYKAGLNFMILMLAAYLGQGFIIVNFFLKKWKWPGILRMLLYLFLIIQPVFWVLVVLWGIFDVWFNFRKMQAQGTGISL